ncbi:hypothetical protein BH24CHL7_BH24CHL7_01360 [soil metagenome]
MLRGPRDFAALQGSSRSRVDPLIVLRFTRNDRGGTRFGFSTGRKLGGAVVRNKVRRRLRMRIQAMMAGIAPGWDVLVVARPAAADATYAELGVALERLMRQAGIMHRTGGTGDAATRVRNTRVRPPADQAVDGTQVERNA